MSILEADHARIVAEATAEARAAERRHWEARFRNAEQAHAAALAAVERLPGHTAHAYIETSDWSGGQSAQVRFQQSEQGRWVDKGDVLTLLGNAAAAPRTLTADCPHLAEMYVGQSGRDNEHGRRSPVIECLACGALRLDDETVPPERLAGGNFDTSGQPRTLTADDRPDYKWDQEEVDDLRRQGYERGLADARAAVDAVGRWRSFPVATLLSRAAVLAAIDALIHDGEATP